MLNPNLQSLNPYPFEQLASLLEGVRPPAGLTPIPLSIGEPQHNPPSFVLDTLTEHVGFVSKYPSTKGSEALRQSIARWVNKRFSLEYAPINPEKQVIPVNGTREAIFASLQAAANETAGALVVMPNPFYQIYEGATLLAGLTPHYLQVLPSGQPDYLAVPDSVWKDCQFCFICTPGNPTGTVISEGTLEHLILKANEFDFWLASDECYSEIYRNSPPPGLLEVCAKAGNTDYSRCIVFHSLSKRSNLPGLRSGFVAGDSKFIEPFLKYRTYHGCSMPLAVQKASELAWSDEQHVIKNRALYADKFDSAAEILEGRMDTRDPGAGFYLWAKTPGACDIFSKELFEATGVTVLPGQYLGRDVNGSNPGAGFVRMALVAEPETCKEALRRINSYITR